jgi:hypothetical protein
MTTNPLLGSPGPELFLFIYSLLAMACAAVPTTLHLSIKGHLLGLLSGFAMIFISLSPFLNGAPLTKLVMILTGGASVLLWFSRKSQKEAEVPSGI